MKNYDSIIAFGLMRLKMQYAKHVLLRRLINDAVDPDKCQENVLKDILLKNRNTVLGKEYNFNSIGNVLDYLKRIPIFEYEKLRPYIEKQIETGEHTIVRKRPVMYAQTSGTIGKPKYIPILQDTIDSYKRAQSIASYIQYHAIGKIFSGKVLAIVSPPIEGHLNNLTPYGSMSGLVYENMPEIISSKYVLPPALFKITDYETKYLLIAALALSEAKITCLATANPSTLIKLSEIINQHYAVLIKFVATGNFDVLGVKLEKKQKKKFSAYVMPNPDRAKALEVIIQQKGELNFSDIWPDLRAVVTWTSGNCTLLLPKICKQLLPQTKVIEMGYLSSEFRGTITIDCEHNLGVPTIQDNFFEFVEIDNWDNGKRDTLLLSQLETGKKYYIIVTAMHGLYRYFINDIIEVTGKFKNTPTMAFVQKGKGVTNLTGEKLYESQVIQAVKLAASAHNFEPIFFMMLADQAEFSYRLYIETESKFDIPSFTTSLNAHLGAANIEYLSKAQSGRIKLADVKCLKRGVNEVNKSFCIQSGQREGQFKVVQLQYRSDVKFLFEEHVVS